jgi:1,4-dihydroxy-6-naphthoate synthase
MDEQVMRQHIDLYVNNYSLGLGDDGVMAVKTLLKTWSEINTTSPSAPFSVVS